VAESGVCDFSAESAVDKLLPKKFRGDKDYRAAVVEAVRIATSFGVEFPAAVTELVAGCQAVSAHRHTRAARISHVKILCPGISA